MPDWPSIEERRDDHVAALKAAAEAEDSGGLYSESMSLACCYGRCEDCPDASEPDDLLPLDCTCVCHIPEDDQ